MQVRKSHIFGIEANQRYPRITPDNPIQEEPLGTGVKGALLKFFMQCGNVRIYTYVTGTIIARGKRFLKAPKPIFVKVKSYHFQLKLPSKFNMTLISDSPFNKLYN